MDPRASCLLGKCAVESHISALKFSIKKKNYFFKKVLDNATFYKTYLR